MRYEDMDGICVAVTVGPDGKDAVLFAATRDGIGTMVAFSPQKAVEIGEALIASAKSLKDPVITEGCAVNSDQRTVRSIFERGATQMDGQKGGTQ